MKIPYGQIIEVRMMKDDIDQSRLTGLSKWFYNIGYKLQCRPILKKLERSKENINYIKATDLILFAQFVSQTGYDDPNIHVKVSTGYGNISCVINFKSINTSFTAVSYSDKIGVYIHGKKKDTHKELISLNTGISPGNYVYNSIMTYIIEYLKGENNETVYS